jgi:uncharacterized membrane protein YgdD (TMEM256/DUF423 family)
MNSLMEISAGVGIANVVLLIALLTVYAKVYNSTRAVFTIGLIFFAGMLMLHNIIAVYAYFAMQPLYAVGLLPYFAVIHIAELAGIAALLKVTL